MVERESSSSVDPARCPLCGAGNACAMTVDPDAKHCWCFDAVMSTEALAGVPPEAMGVACICARCASGEDG